ncbi:MAG: hypothetical protein KC415_22715, partial [Anaerolineales bacterium]|nr:hypothetical protein [Anaerolineales bacterium]
MATISAKLGIAKQTPITSLSMMTKSHPPVPFSVSIVTKIWPFLLILLVFWAVLPRTARGAVVLDGLRDAAYGDPIATDSADDLAVTGSNLEWMDQTALYCYSENTDLYVYADLSQYSQFVSTGEVGLLLGTQGGGGSSDPWLNAITYAHTDPPDYAVRGNIPGSDGDSNGWTELRTWGGSDWTAGGTNWGGISGGGQIGSRVAYANNQGVEFKFTFAELGVGPGTAVSLQLFATQKGSGHGAYDTVSSDDQATGWQDPTTLTQWATCTIPGTPPTPGNTPTSTSTPTTPNGCDTAVTGDNTITPDALYHIDTDPNYRQPLGDIPQDGAATITLRSCAHDLTAVEILVWQTGDPLNSPSNIYPMSLANTVGDEAYWQVAVPGPGSAIDQWYQFRLTDGSSQDFYRPISDNTGVGHWQDELGDPSWRLGTIVPTPTLPAPYAVPDWVQDAVIYQIFPDRFRNGDAGNDAVDGTAVYEPDGCAGYPHPRPGGATSGCLHDLRDSWQTPLYIPSWGLDFYGGDLQGV